jgi:Na+-driven multidrug efflux pump
MLILELYIAIGILIAGFVLFSISLNKDIVKEVEFTTKEELTFYVLLKSVIIIIFLWPITLYEVFKELQEKLGNK